MMRKPRWSFGPIALSLAVLPLLAAPVRAQPCAPLDLECLAGDVGGTPDGAIGDDPVDDGAVDDVTGTVDPVAQTVTDEVGRLLGGGTELPPGGGGGGVPTPPGGGGGHVGGSDRALVTTLLHRRALLATSETPPAVTTELIGPAGDSRDLPAWLAEAASGAVRSLAVVLGLLGVAVGFVIVQNGLDRRDPRLSLAPVDSDVVAFT